MQTITIIKYKKRRMFQQQNNTREVANRNDAKEGKSVLKSASSSSLSFSMSSTKERRESPFTLLLFLFCA
jgi:hypothetical protein